jgi:hypothetical protein
MPSCRWFLCLYQVFGGAHMLTQFMTAPSLELLIEGMTAPSKEKASHQKQACSRIFSCYTAMPIGSLEL